MRAGVGPASGPAPIPAPLVLVDYTLSPGGAHPSDQDPWGPVRRALPRFRGHRQPRIPLDFGYYDPRNGETHERQFALARSHGVGAFIYDLAPGESSAPHLPEFDGADVRFVLRLSGGQGARGGRVGGGGGVDWFAEEVAPLHDDRRYATLDSRPVVAVPAQVGAAAITTLRSRLENLTGIPPFVIVEGTAAEWGRGRVSPAFGVADAVLDPAPGPLDEPSVALRPHTVDGSGPFDCGPYAGPLASYGRVMSRELARPSRHPDLPLVHSVVPGYDDSPLRGSDGCVVVGDDPELFGNWLRQAIEFTLVFAPPARWVMHAGSWNDWASGTFIEPDVDGGSSRLRALRGALAATAGLREAISAPAQGGHDALVGTLRAYMRAAAATAGELLATWERG